MDNKEKRPNLMGKLKKAMENISVDIFGLEKKVSRNVINYLTTEALDLGVPVKQLRTRIMEKDDTIKVYLHHQAQLVKEIPLCDLVYFFADEGTAGLFNLEAKTIERIKPYMAQLRERYPVNKENLQIRISTNGNKVIVRAYNDMDYIRDISVKELIKYFR